jgi:hypothetical protein
MNFLPEKKYGVPSNNFVKKNVLCEKGDEIARFDGTHWLRPRKPPSPRNWAHIRGRHWSAKIDDISS